MVDAMRPIVIYDGECRFCLWSIHRIQRLDRQNLFDYMPRQIPGLEAVYPRLADSDFNTGMRLIVGTGQIYYFLQVRYSYLVSAKGGHIEQLLSISFNKNLLALR